MRRRGGAMACAALVAAAALPARAQSAPQVVDRIVGIVGETPILFSQLQEEILQRQANNQLQLLPTRPRWRRCATRCSSR